MIRRASIGLTSLLVIAACSSADDAGPTSSAGLDDGSAPAADIAGDGQSTVTTPATSTEPAHGDAVATVPSASGDSSSANTVVDGSSTTIAPVPFEDLELVVFAVPDGSRPHDVAPARDGGVWYAAQGSGELGYLDVATGATRHIALGPGSAPHGVIVDAEGLAWVTDSGLNAIVSVDPATDTVTTYPLPPNAPDANLNTAASDGAGRLWITGQNGIYGVLDPVSGEIEAYPSPRGRGPYGIAATPDGQIYFASLAGSYVGFVTDKGTVVEIDPPTAGQGARRVWADSTGAIWVSEWNSGQLSRFDPDKDDWSVWRLPGDDPTTYAVYVDGADQVWVSDFGGNAIHRFDPMSEAFETFGLPADPGNVRQILGRDDEIWGAQSADDSLIVIRPSN